MVFTLHEQVLTLHELGKKKKVFLMHEMVKISYKVCTTNSTQLYKNKKMVFTWPEQVFTLHELGGSKMYS